MKKVIITFIFFISWRIILSQTAAFTRVDTIPVKISGNTIKNPWAGGLNFCQFSPIDLNQDGIKDLFVFDKTGNKVSTFINNGTVNTIDYKHAPEYQNKFPTLQNWALLVDYNCDGKEDIFTYSIYGIAVYMNISNSTNGLQFKLITNILYTQYPSGGSINIYVPAIDVPAITDMDNDGDIDIVTMDFSGYTMEYHKNKSKELYGICDSLTFERNTGCWGKIFESPGSNDIALGISCKSDGSYKTGEQYKTLHGSGSSELCLDMDGDGDKEMLIGMLGYYNYQLLTNGGDINTADITAQEKNFPANDTVVDMASFPCGFNLDVNNDGLKDLLVSPGTENISQNFTSVWYYKNTGTSTNTVFTYQQNDFLQNEMIETGEGAYPVFFDYDGDGLQDLLIGNYAYHISLSNYQSKISLYKNIGTATNPKFDLITRDFNNLSAAGLLNICPSFGDLDGDGDSDMMVGERDGKLYYYENTAGTGNTASFILSQADYTDVNGTAIDVGKYASPQIIDVNRDGKNDLIIGAQNGKISYYENTGTTTSPAFTLMSSNFGGVTVSKSGYITGYSHPCLFDDAGSYKLMTGSESGYLYYHTNIDNNLSGNFTLADSAYLNTWEGSRTAPYISDINNDGLKDMIIGNYSGGVGYYAGTIINSAEKNLNMEISFELFPNPSSDNCIIRLKNYPEDEKIIFIYDMIGREVMQEKERSNVFTINTSDLKNGVYICKIAIDPSNKQSHKEISKRLVILH